MKTSLLQFNETSLTLASDLLKNNEIVALPTETVYGLAGNAFEETAIQKIFEAKERPAFDPLIVHISKNYLFDSIGILKALVRDGILDKKILDFPVAKKITDAMNHFWPGPLTFILPCGDKISQKVTHSQKWVGIRCPNHSVFQAVLSLVSFPLAAPSANRFGRISPTEASHVLSELNGKIPAILDGGPSEVGLESTIIRIDDPFKVTLLRPGKISASELKSVFQIEILSGQSLLEAVALSQITPGSLSEHYAPTKPLFLFPSSFSDPTIVDFFIKNKLNKDLGLLCFAQAPNLSSSIHVSKISILSPKADLDEAARLLFKKMRELDEDKKVITLVADLPEPLYLGLGAAIADRLRRASRNKPVLVFSS